MANVGWLVMQQLKVSEGLFVYSEVLCSVYESTLWLTNVSGFQGAV